jgi:vanillate O-demethylase monooxygenase subunit
MNWIRNAWYVAAASDELPPGAVLGRRLFGTAYALFRDAEGAPAVLEDICPHKLAPLSRGTCEEGRLACPYHGLTFAADGRCVRIPGQEAIPAALRVGTLPCRERHGWIWVWPGDPARADPALLFAPPRQGPGWDGFFGPPLVFPSGIDAILDNLVDPAHTSFVHRRTIGGADAADIPLRVTEEPGTLTVGRWIENSAPVPVMARYGGFTGRVDRWQIYHLHLPNVSVVDMGAVAAGTPRKDAMAEAPYRTYSIAGLTPETETTTHYFWRVLRNFAPGDAAVSAEMRDAYLATFEEDRVLLAAITEARRSRPAETLLGIDTATIRLRRGLTALRQAD